MNPCNELIARVYNNPKVVELLNKIKPTELREDLRQELAVVLLNYDCKKIKQMEADGKLISFSRRVLWKMATLPNGDFYKTYRKNVFLPLETDDLPEPNEIKTIDSAEIITVELNKKMTVNVNEAHEAIIFNKYRELMSCEKVAEFFGVPRIHIFRVVKKVKNELKIILQNENNNFGD